MSGLVAIFNPRGIRGSVRDLIDRVPSHARHRDIWSGPTFAAARLHHGIFDRESQPIRNESGRFCVFAEGELLDAPGEGGQAGSLAHRCLRGLQGDYADFADFNGSFAAIAFDSERNQMLVVSDRLNTRPLYWFQSGSEVVIASSVAALTGHPDCPSTLDQQTLHELVGFRQLVGNSTIYKGIKWIDPGSVSVFDGESWRTHAYWRLRWREPSFPRRELPERIAAAVHASVGRRLARTAGHCIFLSGGLDSRLILAASDTPPLCLTLGDVETDQIRTAREAARLKGAEHKFLPVGAEDFEKFFEEGVRLTGAIYGYQQNHFLPIADRAAEHAGVVFTGSYLDTFLRGSRLPQAKLKLGGAKIALPWLQDADEGDLVARLVAGQKQAFPKEIVHRALTPEAAGEQSERLSAVVRNSLAGFDGPSPLLAWNHLLFRSISRNYAFPNVTSIRTRLESTIVAWDNEVLDLSLSMRPEWGWPDTAYRQALNILSPTLARLPNANDGLRTNANVYLRQAYGLIGRAKREAERRLQRRSLTGPSSWLDFAGMLRQPGSLRTRLENLPRSEALAECGLFDPRGLQGLVDDHLSGRRDLAKWLLQLMTIENWIVQFGGQRESESRSGRRRRKKATA